MMLGGDRIKNFQVLDEFRGNAPTVMLLDTAYKILQFCRRLGPMFKPLFGVETKMIVEENFSSHAEYHEHRNQCCNTTGHVRKLLCNQKLTANNS